MIEWNKYKNFSKWEFDCKHTGLNRMRPEFLDILQQIRSTYGKPMIVNSGYRDHAHPIEKAKAQAGEHYFGVAADISVSGVEAMDLFVVAYGYGIRRIGLQQSGKGRFIHIGMGDQLGLHFPSALWTY